MLDAGLPDWVDVKIGYCIVAVFDGDTGAVEGVAGDCPMGIIHDGGWLSEME